MSLSVYDYRNDLRNVLVTPQIRARFLRMEPGQVAQLHSHDLGHEVFLVLEGRARFEIDGETAEVGPGQMCVALSDQKHSVRVLGDKPMTMYLSVTPHIQPTHTMYNKDGQRLPYRFVVSKVYDVADTDVSIEDLISRHLDLAQSLADMAQDVAKIQGEMGARLKKAIAEDDKNSAAQARGAMWEALFALYEKTYALADVWNHLAAKSAKAGLG